MNFKEIVKVTNWIVYKYNANINLKKGKSNSLVQPLAMELGPNAKMPLSNYNSKSIFLRTELLTRLCVHIKINNIFLFIDDVVLYLLRYNLIVTNKCKRREQFILKAHAGFLNRSSVCKETKRNVQGSLKILKESRADRFCVWNKISIIWYLPVGKVRRM